MAITITTNNGDWNTGGNWSAGVPTVNDHAEVLHDMTIDGIGATFDELYVHGAVELTADQVWAVKDGGLIDSTSGTINTKTYDIDVTFKGDGASDWFKFSASGLHITADWGIGEHHFERCEFFGYKEHTWPCAHYLFDDDCKFYSESDNGYMSAYTGSRLEFTPGKTYTFGDGVHSNFKTYWESITVIASGVPGNRIYFDGNNQTGYVYCYGINGINEYTFTNCDFYDSVYGLYLYLMNNSTKNVIARVENCKFYDNYNHGFLGYNWSGTQPEITGCTSHNNGGDGFYWRTSASGFLGFADCSGYNNTANGIFMEYDSADFEHYLKRCVAYGNGNAGITTLQGYVRMGNPQWSSCLSYENGQYGFSSHLTLSGCLDHCTSVDNLANYETLLGQGDYLEIKNSISASGTYGVYANSYNDPTYSTAPDVKFSNVWGASTQNYYGTGDSLPDMTARMGNISENPMFSAASGDYHLQDGSPCIGGATPSGGLSYDIDNDLRPSPAWTTPDMGCYENQTVFSNYNWFSNAVGTEILSEDHNWSQGTKPAANEDYIFRSGWNETAQVDSDIDLGDGDFIMASGFYGSVKVNSNIECSGFYANSGEILLNNSKEITVNDEFYCGGDLQRSINLGSGALSHGGKWDTSGSNLTFDAGTSTIKYGRWLPGRTVKINTGSVEFYSWEPAWRNYHLGVLELESDVTVNGDISFPATSSNQVKIDGSGNTINIKGDLLFADGGNGNIVRGSSSDLAPTFEFNGTGDQNFISNFQSLSRLYCPVVINKPSGTLTLSGTTGFGHNLIHQNGTVDAGTSEIMFYQYMYGVSSAILNTNSGALQFWDVYQFPYVNDVILSGGDMIINGTWDIPYTTSNFSKINTATTEKVQVKGDIKLGASSTNMYGDAPIVISGSGDQTINTDSVNNIGKIRNPFEIDKLSGTLTIQGSITLGQRSYATSFTYTNGTVDTGTSTLTLYGNPLTFDHGSIEFYTLNLYTDTELQSNLNVNNNLTIGYGETVPYGDVRSNGYQINIGGDFRVNKIDNFYNDQNTIVFDGTGSHNIESYQDTDLELHNVTFNNTDGVWTLASGVAIGGTLDIQAGQFNLAGEDIALASSGTFSNIGTLGLYGTENIGSLVNDTNSGTIEYNGPGTYTGLLLGSGYYNIAFAGGDYILDEYVTCRDFTINSGIVDASGNNIYVKEDWRNSGTFIASDNSVDINGNPVDSYIYGSTTFANLSLLNGERTIYLESGETQTVTGDLTINGYADSSIQLRPMTAESDWLLNHTGSKQSIMYVDVMNSDASVGKRIDATDRSNTDSGLNSNWFFASPPHPSGFFAMEHYLYANKEWEVIPSGVTTYRLSKSVLQNAPVIVTSSGWETTRPSDPWAQVEGSGKWRKRGHGFFTVTPAGVYDTSVKEFTMNPSSSGKIEFNQELKEILYVEYETSASGYYYIDTIDINPMMRETNGGFLQITGITQPAYLSLSATQSILKADGFQTSLLTATLWDYNLNRVKDKEIVFEMLFNIDSVTGPWVDMGQLIPGELDGTVYKVHPSGFISETKAFTNNFGQCTATFLTNPNKDGLASFKAYYLDASGIYDIVDIAMYRWSRGPFILDESILDGLDYLT